MGRTPLWDERPHGGFYTQDDLREIVAYAAERHVTVVPEIDLPGHSQAAIAAYPGLGNTDVIDTSALEVWTEWGFNRNVLAPTDAVLRFYEGVLEEVLEIFPGPFVHIGGDECFKDQWRASPAAQARIRDLGLGDEDGLQSWMIGHFADWLAARGRRLIGWDEILEGGLAEGAAVMCWRWYRGGIAAAESGHSVVMCPQQEVYLDHVQAPGAEEPVPFGWVHTLEDVYRFEPVPPRLAGTPHAANIIGTQANLWTEVVEDRGRVDYQAFPGSPRSPRWPGRTCPARTNATSPTSSAGWTRRTMPVWTRSASATARPPDRTRGSSAPASPDECTTNPERPGTWRTEHLHRRDSPWARRTTSPLRASAGRAASSATSRRGPDALPPSQAGARSRSGFPPGMRQRPQFRTVVEEPAQRARMPLRMRR